MVIGKASWTERRWVLGLVIILAGCAQPQPAPSPPPKIESPLALADKRLETGDFAGAADEYARLGTAPDAVAPRLQAALIRQDLGQANAPDERFEGADPALLGLLNGAQALAAGDPASALNRLPALGTRQFNPYQRGLYLRTLGGAQLASGDPDAAAVNLTLAERYPLPPNGRTKLTYAIWQALTAAEERGVRPVLKAEAPHATGWLALLDVAGKAGAHAPDFAGRLATWQSQFAEHPAHLLLVDELLERSEEASQAVAPRQIALLLPLEGKLARAALAIQDGFLAARFEDAAGREQAKVVSYATTPATLDAVMQRALDEGADFIVGPLEKSAVDSLRLRSDRKLPTLALNATDGEVKAGPRFFQFGLRPEDEAVDAAERAWRENRRRPVVLVPNTELGTRLLAAFEARWQQLGGELLGSARFNRNVGSYAESVKRLFGLSESQARATALVRLLGRPIAFDMQTRDDVDAVIMAAAPLDARQILPQFRYFGTDAIPIYATSLINEGALDTRADKDLDGVMFGDTPWTLGQGNPALRAAANRYWRLSPAEQRLFAFGADAWRMVNTAGLLSAGSTQRLSGATGELWLGEQGIVHRRLVWARFADGKPQPLP